MTFGGGGGGWGYEARWVLKMNMIVLVSSSRSSSSCGMQLAYIHPELQPCASVTMHAKPRVVTGLA